MKLALEWESCVRTRSLSAECRACVDACPAAAVTVDGPRGSVAVDASKCIDCGLCQAACPTESFSGAVDVAAFVQSAGASLSCTEALCLAALSAEDLVTLAARHGTLRVDVAGCAKCRTAPKGQQALAARAEQAREFLVGAGLEARVTISMVAPAASAGHGEGRVMGSRRAFLQRFVPQAIKDQPLLLDPAKLDAKKLRAQRVPARRERMLSALATAKRKDTARKLEAATIGFTSNKALDLGTCTACMQCVTACPTGALTTSKLKDELRFDASRCVKCATCHDVCEPDAITVAPLFDTATFLAREAQLLGKLPVKQCGECGQTFKYAGGEVLCERCREQDDEARELHGLPPRGVA